MPVLFFSSFSGLKAQDPYFEETFNDPASLSARWTSAPAGTPLVTEAHGTGQALKVTNVAVGSKYVMHTLSAGTLQAIAGRRIIIAAQVKAADVSAKPNAWNGIKVMLKYTTSDGVTNWPQITLPVGTFDWSDRNAVIALPANITSATLHLGLEAVSGTAWFDNVRIVDEIGARLDSGLVTISQLNATTWQTLTFGQTYTSPVVVFGPVSWKNGEPAMIRVRNVTATSCEYQLDEWDYQDGAHTTQEQVSFLVMEAGTYQIGGLRWEAGKKSGITQTAAAQSFGSAFPAVPVVLAQVATTNEASAVMPRLSAVTASGFTVQMDEQEAGTRTHAAESVHYIAIQQGTGSLTDGDGQVLAFQAGLSTNTISSAWANVYYSRNLAVPHIFGNIQTRNDTDPVVLRYNNSNYEYLVTLMAQEETSLDAETTHGNEVAGFLALASEQDTDGDGMSDVWELANGFNPNNSADALLDPDNDGQQNLIERRFNTNPLSFDNVGTITITADIPTAYERNNTEAKTSGRFTITRTGGVAQATINFTLSGTTSPPGQTNADYKTVIGWGAGGNTVVLPFGSTSTSVTIEPTQDTLNEYPETVTMTLAPAGTAASGGRYTVGIASNANVIINDATDIAAHEQAFVAFLAPVSGSSGSGLGRLFLNGPKTKARVSLNFSGLTSAQTNAYLRYGGQGIGNTTVSPNLGTGSIQNVTCNIAPTAPYSGQQIIDALYQFGTYGGRWDDVSLGTTSFPNGEISGRWNVQTQVPTPDTDNDGIPDAYEQAHLAEGLNPNDPSDATRDADGDGMTNVAEVFWGRNPFQGEKGFPNVTRPSVEATEIAAGRAARISGPWKPEMGRLSAIAYHQGWVFTLIEASGSFAGFDGLERMVDLSNPAAPVEKASWDAGFNPGFSAHGTMQLGTELISSSQWKWNVPTFRQFPIPPLLPTVSLPSPNISGERGFNNLGGLYPPWEAQTFWSYRATDHNARLVKNGVLQKDWNMTAETGGVIGHPIIIGNLLIYAGDQSHTGVATYDISDPTNPRLLDVLNADIGGYFPEVWGHYVVFEDNVKGLLAVVDFEDPENLKWAASIPLASAGNAPMYVQFQDEFAFTGRYKVNMKTFQPVLSFNEASAFVNQYFLPLGNLVLTGGNNATFGGLNVWSHQAAPDTRPPSVEYHIPRPDQINYPVGAPISLLIHETLDSTTVNANNILVRNVATGQLVSLMQLPCAHNDVITIQPSTALAQNATYEVEVVAGGIKDACGNGIERYTFRFSTGSLTGGNQPPASVTLTSNAHPVAPGGSVTFTASGTDPEGGALQYLFDFGDATAATSWSSTKIMAHTYAAAGHYTAKVKVKDSLGSITMKTMVVTVITAPVAPFPTFSTPVTQPSIANGNVWALNPDQSTFSWVSTSAFTPSSEKIAGRTPRSLAVAANGNVWIVCRGDDRIDIVSDGATNRGAILGQIPLPHGSAPEAIAMSPDKSKAFVTLSGSGKLARFNTTTLVKDSEVTLGSTPRAIAVTGDASRVLVTRFISPKDRGEVWSVPNLPAGLGTPTVIPLAIDPGPDTLSSGRGVPNYLTAIAITPDSKRAWVAAKKDNVNRGSFVNGQLPTPDNAVRAMIAVIDLTTNTEIMSQRRDIDNSEGASAICFSPLGDYAFVAQRGNNLVAIYDVLTQGQAATLGGTSLRARLGVSSSPDGLFFDASQRLWVRNFLNRSVSIFNLDAFLRSGGGFASPTVAPVKTASVETLSASVLKGKKLFYGAGGFQLEGAAAGVADFRMSSEGYISCATCHLDGGSDDRVWDFTNRGEGLRNTIPLWGRNGMGHGNVHWSGNFDEIQDFEHDIRGPFGGDGFMTDFNTTTDSPLGLKKAGRSADLDALASYVASLGASDIPRSPFRNSNGTMTAAAINGQGYFTSKGCATCHSGVQFTDSTAPVATLRDVGTVNVAAGSGQRLGAALTGIDTPTLRGVWATAPYLHRGQAADLPSVFNTVNAPSGKGHDRFRELTAAQQGELIRYLMELE